MMDETPVAIQVPKSWICFVCTHLNDSSLVACTICNTIQRPIESMSSSMLASVAASSPNSPQPGAFVTPSPNYSLPFAIPLPIMQQREAKGSGIEGVPYGQHHHVPIVYGGNPNLRSEGEPQSQLPTQPSPSLIGGYGSSSGSGSGNGINPGSPTSPSSERLPSSRPPLMPSPSFVKLHNKLTELAIDHQLFKKMVFSTDIIALDEWRQLQIMGNDHALHDELDRLFISEHFKMHTEQSTRELSPQDLTTLVRSLS
jgi:hypothetical protein